MNQATSSAQRDMNRLLSCAREERCELSSESECLRSECATELNQCVPIHDMPSDTLMEYEVDSGPPTEHNETGAENTDELCSDGVDNDGNEFTDCEDFGCSHSESVTVCGESF